MTRLKGGVIWAGVIAFHIIGFIPHAHAADLLEGPRVSGGGFGGGLKDGPADLPPLWAGFYVGGYAGGVWTGTNLSDGFTYEGDPSYKGTFDGTGFTGGGTLGYNIQRGHAVFGVEGDIGYLSLSGSKAVNYTQPAGCSHTYADTGYTAYPSDLCGVNANYSLSGGLYGDITGRAGYAFDNILLYAKGGAAFLDADVKSLYLGQNCATARAAGTYDDSNCPAGGPAVFSFSHSATLSGWTAGGGGEYALTPQFSVRIGYQHFDFGNLSYTYSGAYLVPCVNCTHNDGHYTSTIDGRASVHITADAVTVGLSYHLN